MDFELYFHVEKNLPVKAGKYKIKLKKEDCHVAILGNLNDGVLVLSGVRFNECFRLKRGF